MLFRSEPALERLHRQQHEVTEQCCELLLGLSKLSPFLAGPSNAGNMWLTAGVVERGGGLAQQRPGLQLLACLLAGAAHRRPSVAPVPPLLVAADGHGASLVAHAIEERKMGAGIWGPQRTLKGRACGSKQHPHPLGLTPSQQSGRHHDAKDEPCQ